MDGIFDGLVQNQGMSHNKGWRHNRGGADVCYVMIRDLLCWTAVKNLALTHGFLVHSCSPEGLGVLRESRKLLTVG